MKNGSVASTPFLLATMKWPNSCASKMPISVNENGRPSKMSAGWRDEPFQVKQRQHDGIVGKRRLIVQKVTLQARSNHQRREQRDQQQ